MSELENILISHTDKHFYAKLAGFRQKIVNAPLLSDREYSKLKKIISDVRHNGDGAVAEYTKKFDNVQLSPDKFRITFKELRAAGKNIDKNLLASIRKAAANVQKYQKQIFIGQNKSFGNTGIKYTPIKRIGICAPGASAPLPSTVIMTAIPAQVAGVKEIAVVSPPRYNGSIHPVILATCYELGITEVYRIGGVQAVAALTYGSPAINNVDKIVGPGNRWVQTAKKEVFGKVSIDSIAGPSEVLIIADDSTNPAYAAADMLSQAEHAPGSATMFTDSSKFAANVLLEIEKQLQNLTRADDTRQCLQNYGLIACFKNVKDIIKWANIFAAEHLQIQCGRKSGQIASKIENAGAIFIGEYSPVAVGDYWAGPSHTLPTGACARFSSALTSNDFVKSISIIEYNKQKLKKISDDIVRLAQAEGLDAHAKSVKIRFENFDKSK